MATPTDQNQPTNPLHRESSGNNTEELQIQMGYSFPHSSATQSPDISGEYPEGGTQGWLCVFGSFMGLVNLIGTFQAYLETHQLEQYGSGKAGWVFGLFTFLTFCGIQIGPIFDARGPRLLILLGSILVMAMMISLGFCNKSWQLVLSISVAGGLGTPLIFTPAISVIAHFFFSKAETCNRNCSQRWLHRRRDLPLVLETLIGKIGFTWATRVVALIYLVCLTTACLLVTSRLPSKSISKRTISPDLWVFRDPEFLMTTLSAFFIEWGLFVPISYISSYALANDVPTRLSYQLLAILNAGSFLGRLIPSYLANLLGHFNTLIIRHRQNPTPNWVGGGGLRKNPI